MSAECCDMFPRCKNVIPLVHIGTSTIISATKASLHVCPYIPRGVPHPIRFTSVPRPLRHLILVDFAGNLVHLRSFVSESIFEPVAVRCFDWVVGHRYSAFGHKTEMLESVSQNIFFVISGNIPTKNLRRQSPELPKYQTFSDILLPLRPTTCAVTFYAVTFCNSAINVKYL